MANRTPTPARVHREEDLDPGEQIRYMLEELGRALRMITAMIDALEIKNVPDELDEFREPHALTERDKARVEEIRKIRALFLVIGDVMGKYLDEAEEVA